MVEVSGLAAVGGRRSLLQLVAVLLQLSKCLILHKHRQIAGVQASFIDEREQMTFVTEEPTLLHVFTADNEPGLLLNVNLVLK